MLEGKFLCYDYSVRRMGLSSRKNFKHLWMEGGYRKRISGKGDVQLGENGSSYWAGSKEGGR